MVREKSKLSLWIVIGSSLILTAIFLFSQTQQAHAPGTLPARLTVIQDQALPLDSIEKIYQNGRIEIETGQHIWWSADSRSLYFRAFQNTWEYCLSCRIAKQAWDRYPSSKPPPADLTRAGSAAELIRLDSQDTVLLPADSKTSLPPHSAWDGWVAYPDEAGCWKLAGYIAKDDLLVEWLNFCQVAGLEGFQPVQGRLSPDGRWAAFAAGKDSQSFETIWLIFLDASQQ